MFIVVNQQTVTTLATATQYAFDIIDIFGLLVKCFKAY